MSGFESETKLCLEYLNQYLVQTTDPVNECGNKSLEGTQGSQELVPISENAGPLGDRILRDALSPPHPSRVGQPSSKSRKELSSVVSVKAARPSLGSRVCFPLRARVLGPAPKWPQASAQVLPYQAWDQKGNNWLQASDSWLSHFALHADWPWFGGSTTSRSHYQHGHRQRRDQKRTRALPHYQTLDSFFPTTLPWSCSHSPPSVPPLASSFSLLQLPVFFSVRSALLSA